MKTKLLKKIRNNYRIKKITHLNGYVFYIIKKRFNLFFIIQIWNTISAVDIFPISIGKINSEDYEYIFGKMKEIFHQKYYKYSRKYIIKNTSKKNEILWYKNNFK